MNASGGITTDDPWYYFIYDDQWRIIATYGGSGDGTSRDTYPKEHFIYHNAGLGELGAASSYIDAVILRDKDNSSAWANAASSTMEQRIFYCQNWRADVVALIGSNGNLLQHVRYGEYGEPFGMPAGDTDGDGDYDSNDSNQIQAWALLGSYDVRGDTELDGDVDFWDYWKLTNHTLGWGVLSETNIFNRKGYAGYETDHIVAAVVRLNHVRNRVYNVTLGRWMTRDPIEYEAGLNLYEYVRSNPLGHLDPSGLKLTVPTKMDKCLEDICPGTTRGRGGLIVPERKEGESPGCATLRRLIEDKNTHSATENGSDVEPGGGRMIPNKKGGSRIRYPILPIKGKDIDGNDVEFSPCEVLLHELVHAQHLVEGIYLEDYNEEIKTIKQVNVWREWWNDNVRDKDKPLKPLRDPYSHPRVPPGARPKEPEGPGTTP